MHLVLGTPGIHSADSPGFRGYFTSLEAVVEDLNRRKASGEWSVVDFVQTHGKKKDANRRWQAEKGGLCWLVCEVRPNEQVDTSINMFWRYGRTGGD